MFCELRSYRKKWSKQKVHTVTSFLWGCLTGARYMYIYDWSCLGGVSVLHKNQKQLSRDLLEFALTLALAWLPKLTGLKWDPVARWHCWLKLQLQSRLPAETLAGLTRGKQGKHFLNHRQLSNGVFCKASYSKHILSNTTPSVSTAPLPFKKPKHELKYMNQQWS